MVENQGRREESAVGCHWLRQKHQRRERPLYLEVSLPSPLSASLLPLNVSSYVGAFAVAVVVVNDRKSC